MDKATLWNQLQDIQRKEMETLVEERNQLENEKQAMKNVNADTSDIIEINVGGEAIICASRKTLCLVPESLFAHLFSGRWDDACARDHQGRVFLDHDPELVRLIVNFLRIKRIEDPSHPVSAPEIPSSKKEQFMCMLKYFGLSSYFYPTITKSNNDDLVVPGSYRISGRTMDNLGRFTYKCDGTVQLKPDGTFSGESAEVIEGRGSSIHSVIVAGKLLSAGATYTLRYGTADYSYVLAPPKWTQNKERRTLCSFPGGHWIHSKIDRYKNSEQRNKNEGRVVEMIWELIETTT